MTLYAATMSQTVRESIVSSGAIRALSGLRARLADVARGQVDAEICVFESGCYAELVFGDVGEFVADFDVTPGLEAGLKCTLEFSFGRPRILQSNRDIECANIEAVTRAQLETADDHFAAVELVADVPPPPVDSVTVPTRLS